MQAEQGTKVISKNCFGQYLKSLRLGRGFSTATDYLKLYRLPISASYYRDLESGRRLLSMTSAAKICEILKADSHAFFFSLLQDLLPVQATDILNQPQAVPGVPVAPKKQPATAEAKSAKDGDSRHYLPTEELVLSDEAADFLEANIELYEVVLFVFGQSPFGVSDSQLSAFLKQNQLSVSLEFVLRHIRRLGILEVVEGSRSGQKVIRTDKMWLSVNRHRRLVRKWAGYQISKSVRSPHIAQGITGTAAGISYGQRYISKSMLQNLSGELNKSVAAIVEARKYATAGGTARAPYLVRILVVSYPEVEVL